MNNLLIIGAGQLGSRHLQGLLKTTGQNSIFVVDPSDISLELAKSRALEIVHDHKISFSKDMVGLPKSIDMAIIATNSLVREKVATQLLQSTQVKFLVFEKVLFPNLSAYENISQILIESGTKCWVNHPRRMYPHYIRVKEVLKYTEPIHFSAIGSDWGIGCNGLHFIDLFSFIDGTNIASINSELLDNDLQKSKRPGFVEFTGILTGIFESGNRFSLVSFNTGPSPLTIFVNQPSNRILFQEGGATNQIHLSASSNYEPITYPIFQEYQSNLTTELANSLLINKTCSLPEYNSAKMTHKFFISSMLSKYNFITGKENELCPIT